MDTGVEQPATWATLPRVRPADGHARLRRKIFWRADGNIGGEDGQVPVRAMYGLRCSQGGDSEGQRPGRVADLLIRLPPDPDLPRHLFSSSASSRSCSRPASEDRQPPLSRLRVSARGPAGRSLWTPDTRCPKSRTDQPSISDGVTRTGSPGRTGSGASSSEDNGRGWPLASTETMPVTCGRRRTRRYGPGPAGSALPSPPCMPNRRA